MLVLGGGCQTTKVHSSDGRAMPPKPQRAPRVPAGAKANRIAMMVGAKPQDSNGNGYPDLIRVTTYLFSEPHPTPIREEGTFVFELYPAGLTDSEQDLIARWRLGPEELKRAQSVDLPGVCYAFSLGLLEVRSDALPLMMANLACRFEPADGRAPVRPQSVHALQPV